MAEFEEYAPGTFCYIDMASTAPEASKAFYTDLFGLHAESGPSPGGGFYTQFVKGDKWVFGMYEAPPGVPAHWTSHVAVASVSDAIASAESAGGTVVGPPMEIPGVGRTALLADPEGATFAVWESLGFPGSQLANEHGTLIWNELMSSNPESAALFYGAVFGWSVQVQDMPTGPYTLFMDGEEYRAGAMAIAPDMAPMPPHWGVYLAVDDLAAALERAIGLGATAETDVIEPGGVGKMALIKDPAGAYVWLMEPAQQG